MPSEDRPSFLTDEVDWILFGGKGGVGKTTCAAATARYRARHAGEAVRLLSTDPAHSVRDSLGDAAGLDRLTVEEFDAESALEAFRNAHRAILHAIVEKGTLFDDEDIQQLLDLGLPGLDEVMAVLHLAALLEEGDAETVVVDTAPTGHTLRLLDTPAVFGTWLDVLDAMLEKHRTLRATFGRAEGPDALDQFLIDMEDRAERVRTALRDPDRARFVPVTQAEALVLNETERLVADLDRREISLQELVVNQFPRGDRRADAQRRLRARTALLDRFTCWAVPAYSEEVRGPDRLDRVWAHARRLEPAAPDAPDSEGEEAANKGPAVLRRVPRPDHRLLMFAGKGGVGKTTLACATALHRAATDPDASVLLLSTDPAHSLSTALDRPVGDTPTPVAPGLDALEVDAPARFDALRRAYVDEVRQFFRRTTGPNLDLTYDRPVMEGLLDLAPPGVDELMGWTAALEGLRGLGPSDEAGHVPGESVLDGARYDVCVLDPAPTGHFVRLLETPRLVAEWLRAFFRILRKYRDVVRLPTLADRLVRLSKQTKALRRLLEEDGGGVVYGVTLPTSMAWAETDDLIAAAERLGIDVPVLLLNRVPEVGTGPQSPHELLRAVRERYPAQQHGAVADGSPPRGVDALRNLGERLYAEDTTS